MVWPGDFVFGLEILSLASPSSWNEFPGKPHCAPCTVTIPGEQGSGGYNGILHFEAAI